MADHSDKTVGIRVTGKVQGVFYRASTQKQAQALHLRGFVCNESDGSVYLEATGPQEALDVLVAWCRQGPPRAQVDQVEVTPLSPTEFPTGSPPDFQVRR